MTSLARSVTQTLLIVGSCAGIWLLALAAAPTDNSVARDAQAGASVTRLSDGNWLVLGGRTGAGKVSGEGAIFDASLANRTALAHTLAAPRTDHTATVTSDGDVLVVGGVNGLGEPIAEIERYRAGLRDVMRLGDVGLVARSGHTATLLTTGEMLVVGGTDVSTLVRDDAELLDPITLRVTSVGGRMREGRMHARARLLPSGEVLISGGTDPRGQALQSAELFDPSARAFRHLDAVAAAALRHRFDADGAPVVMETLPAADSTGVSIDARFAVRFSEALRPESLTNETVTLLGPGGEVRATVAAAEGGLLVFLTPEQSLLPGSHYTLFIRGARDADGHALPFTAFNYETQKFDRQGVAPPLPIRGASERSEPELGDDDGELWLPSERNLRGSWRSGQARLALAHPPKRNSLARTLYGKSVRNGLPEAPAGVTAVAGQVLKLDGRPLTRVTLAIGSQRVASDENGEFLLSNVPAGGQTMIIDGRTADAAAHRYGRYEYRVDVKAGKTNTLPFIIWMTRLDSRNEREIPSPTTAETVVSSPRIPGLELHLPAGVVVRDADGRVATRISITPIPVDQPPFPLPNSYVPVYFTIQPGGAHLQGLTIEAARGARLIYPNFSRAKPGTRFDFWNYDAHDKGWYVYGHGSVSTNGQQIVPDPGVVIYEFSGAMVAAESFAPDEGPHCAADGSTVDVGDPVDCYTGLFVHRRTDLSLPDILPLEVIRTYRPRDPAARSFGIGTTLSYDMFLVGDMNPYTFQDLILPEGGRIHYTRISPGTIWSDAVYKNTTSPGPYFGSTIRWNPAPSGGWFLELRDGTLYTFPEASQAATPRCAALIEIRDRHGNALTFTRGNNTVQCRLETAISPSGRKLTFSYDSGNRITQVSDDTGRAVTYQYDGSGRLTTATDAANHSESYTYDSAHRMLTVTDKRNNVMVTNVYDTSGRVQQQTYADNTTSTFSYTLNASNKVTQMNYTDERGTVKRTQFDAAGFPTTVIDALGKPEQQTTTIVRDAATSLAQTSTDTLGRVTAYQYDGNSNITQITRLQGTSGAKTWVFTYEPTFNQLATVTDPLNHTTTYGYDSTGNLTSVTDALSHVSSMTYNAASQMTSATRQLNGNPLTTTMTYTRGNLATLTDPLGRTTRYLRDAVGRVTTIKDPLGNLTRVSYDPLDRVTQTTDALGNTTERTYDNNGNLLTFKDGKNNVTQFAYDSRNRATSKTDPLSKVETYGYDAIGNRTRVTDRNGQVTGYGYDSLNRKTSAGFGATVSNPTAFTSTIAYTWDGGNRLVEAIDSASGTISRDFDRLNRLTQEQSPQGQVDYTYYGNGLRHTMTVQGQAAIAYTYDNASRLTQIAQGATNVGFTYDTIDRRATLMLPNGIVVTYGYDDASELTSLTYQKGGTTLGTLTYGYDGAGRRTSMGGTLAQVNLPTVITATVHDAANRVTTWGSHMLVYDDNGALISDAGADTLTYIWDERQRLKEIKQGTTTVGSFQYDAFNRRIGKTISATTTNFLHDGWQIVQELNGSTPTANLLTGLNVDEVFRRTAGTTVEDFLTDALGSTIALADAAGTIQTTYAYEPYGATNASGSASGAAYQYTGRENDGGLYYYRNRYYSSAAGRFVSEDPIGLAGGSNVYTYVGGNPIAYFDPYGLSKWDKTFGLPKKFWNWYHRRIKKPGDPDLEKEEAEQLCKEWRAQGEPGPDRKGKQSGEADIDLLEWLIPWWLSSSPAY